MGDAGNNRVLQFLKAAAVVNAATYQASVPVAQGSLATLFGGGLTPRYGHGLVAQPGRRPRPTGNW